MASLEALVGALVERRGSDLHVHAGSVPCLRIDGRTEALTAEVASAEFVAEVLGAVLTAERAAELSEHGEVLTAVELPGLGRFRVHASRALGGPSLVLRRVDARAPTLEELGLAPGLSGLVEGHRGLVVLTGPAGSGRSSTLAALVDHVNRRRGAVVVSLEEAVEHRHAPLRGFVVQREVGTHTASLAAGLRALAHQDADVVVIGRVREDDDLRGAVELAAGSQLVVAVLDAVSATDTVERLLQAWPARREHQARRTLAAALRGVVCQRLVPRADGRSRVVATEVLMTTPRTVEAILEPDRHGVASFEQLMSEGEYHGMHTLDQALLRLVRDGLVTRRDALAVATHPEDLGIALQAAGLANL